MIICIISDTHNKHKQLVNLPEADIIIHCGDFSGRGNEYEIKDFMDWFSNLKQYKNKICIAGNHDWLFERNASFAKTLVPENVIYLEDSGVEIDGINFYGTPVQKPFFNWAFNRHEEQLIKHWNAIPDNTDVLITHTPPFMILDLVPSGTHEGSVSLYNEIITRINPKVNCFGHLHSNHGVSVIGNTTYVNASNLDESYRCVYEPIVVEI